MKFKERFAEQIVGAFILIAVLGVAATLVFIGINQRWFAKNYYFTSRFNSADGLSVGMPITLKGFEIGKVATLQLTADNKVDVLFFIYDTYYPKVRDNSVLELASNPLGLGGGLRFHPGKNQGPPVPENSFIHSLDLSEGQSLKQRGLVDLPENEDMIGSLLEKLDPILEQVHSTVASVKTLVTTLDDALQGRQDSPVGTIVNELSATSERVGTILDETTTRLNRVLDDTTSRVNGLLASLERISGNVETTTETFGDSTGLVKRLLDPTGSVATLLDDDNALYDRIDGAISDLGQTIDQLKQFVGFVNSSRPQITGILETGQNVLGEGRDVIEAVKNNPLIRGGVPPKLEQPSTFRGYRDEDF